MDDGEIEDGALTGSEIRSYRYGDDVLFGREGSFSKNEEEEPGDTKKSARPARQSRLRCVEQCQQRILQSLEILLTHSAF
jgi:hypothetical protein